MNNPIFNVIIPVYNAEKYVAKAIESVLAQLYSNINIILVDDGSTDNSGSICDEFSSKCKNIQVLHTTNQGLASARNNGMAVVKEGFISFLDSDDSFSDIEMFEKISNVVKLNNPDYIDFGINYISKNGDISKKLNGIQKNILLDKSYIYDNILPPLLNINGDNNKFVFDFAWNKIYKKEIIDKYNILFIPNRRIWEDRPFVIDYLSHCESFYSIDEYFYNYMDVPNSLSRKYTNEFFDVILENYKMYSEKFGDRYNFETQYVYRYWCNSLSKMVERSLEQTRVPLSEVYIKINEIFSKKEVIYFFEKRTSLDDTEKMLSSYILNGDIEKFIKYYKKKVHRNKRKGNVRMFLSKIKNKLTR